MKQQPPLTRLQELAGIRKKLEENAITGSDLHILSEKNATIAQKPHEGGGILHYLKLNLTADLAESDVKTLIKELSSIAEKLNKLNVPK